MSPATNPSHTHIPGLDGLRAIAIGFVLFAHTFEFSSIQPLGSIAGKMGAFGVHLFFAISGYLITSRLAGEIDENHPSRTLKAFYLRRVFRILPPLLPYFVVLILCMSMGSLAVTSREIWAAALFASNYVQGKSWYTSHFWSLSAEEHFYLVWAPIVVLLGIRRAQWAVAALIAVTVLLRPIALAHSTLNMAMALQQTHLQLDLFGYASLFALWMRYPNFRDWVAQRATLPAVCLTLSLLPVSAINPGTFDLRTLQAVLMGALVLLLSTRPQLVATRLLDHPTLGWIGRRSYGIYIWQEIIFVPIATTLDRQFALLLLRTAIVLVVAGVSYRFIEVPILRVARIWSARILSGNPAPALQTTLKASA